MSTDHNPELASILKSLRDSRGISQYHADTTHATGFEDDGSNINSSGSKSMKSNRPAVNVTSDPRRPQTAAPKVDPSKITTWPPAQKYVIEQFYGNATIASKVKQLITNQHSQERRCWAEREALVAKHNGRLEKQRLAVELLGILGGSVGAVEQHPISCENDKPELENYDKKTHRMMQDLAVLIDRELKAMGVPFFAIKHELVVLEEDKAGLEGQQIDRGELRELQRKMLKLLEELFKD